MTWGPKEIRVLRLQLGWSAADFGRRLGCKVDMIMNWESGSSIPDPEMQNQFRFLSMYVERNATRMSQLPHADELMHNERLAQVTHDTVSAKTRN